MEGEPFGTAVGSTKVVNGGGALGYCKRCGFPQYDHPNAGCKKFIQQKEAK